MSFCYLLDDRCLYLSGDIGILTQYKKIKMSYSLYFPLRSGASVFAGSCQGVTYSSILPKCLYTQLKMVLKCALWQFIKDKGGNSYLLKWFK